MPLVCEALERLDRELSAARQEKAKLLKLIHGYGSTGAGGDIRIAAQNRLLEMAGYGGDLARVPQVRLLNHEDDVLLPLMPD